MKQMSVKNRKARLISVFDLIGWFKFWRKLFVFSLENDTHQTSHKRYFLGTEEKEDCKIMTDYRNLFYQPVRNYIKT